MAEKGTKTVDAVIIGGGPAGLTAALTAAGTGNTVAVVDRNREPGRKILASGNGRCNLTNMDLGPEKYPLSDQAFVADVLRGLGPEWLRDFFRTLGLETVAENGRVWPASFEARSVRDRLTARCRGRGVTIHPETRVEAVTPTAGGFRVETYNTAADTTHTFHTRRVLIAAGGKSSAKLGGTDSGYVLARSLGHTIRPLYPGLVPLRTAVSVHHKLQGLKTTARVCLLKESAEQRTTAARVDGDILFTDYGVSGQALLNLASIGASDLARAGDSPLVLSVNFFPDKDAAQLAAWFRERRETFPDDDILFDLEGFLPRKLSRVILERTGIAGSKPDETAPSWRDIDNKTLDRLAEMITHFEIPVRGTRPFDQAMVTVGGVETTEIHSETLESRIQPGLFVAGEILDVQGLSGGYNLHFAFASGYRAGRHLFQEAVEKAPHKRKPSKT